MENKIIEILKANLENRGMIQSHRIAHQKLLVKIASEIHTTYSTSDVMKINCPACNRTRRVTTTSQPNKDEKLVTDSETNNYENITRPNSRDTKQDSRIYF